jgi:hypothetical protein
VLQTRLQRWNVAIVEQPGAIDQDDIEDLESLLLEAKYNLAQAEEGAS